MIQPNSVFSVGEIRGVVYGDSIGAPIPAFVVLLLNSSAVGQVQSNSRGEFEFTNLKPGEYSLAVGGHKGFETLKLDNIKAVPDSVTVVTMQLRPSEGSLGMEPWWPRHPLYLKIDILPINHSDSLQDKEVKRRNKWKLKK